MSIAEFYRTQGARDKRKRKRRDAKTNILLGALAGTAAGLSLAGSKNLLKKTILNRTNKSLGKKLGKVGDNIKKKLKDIQKAKRKKLNVSKLELQHSNLIKKQDELFEKKKANRKILNSLKETNKKRLKKYGGRGASIGLATGVVMPSKNVEEARYRRGYN